SLPWGVLPVASGTEGHRLPPDLPGAGSGVALSGSAPEPDHRRTEDGRPQRRAGPVPGGVPVAFGQHARCRDVRTLSRNVAGGADALAYRGGGDAQLDLQTRVSADVP